MNTKFKQGILATLKILVLVFGTFICFMISSQLAGMNEGNHVSSQLAPVMALSLLLVCLLHTLVLVFYIQKARIQGWALMGSVFLIYFGITTFLSQIESVVFLKYLVSIISLELIGKIFVEGTILSLLLSGLFTLVLGKKSAFEDEVPAKAGQRLQFTWRQWLGKFALICVIYVMIYFCFGYFIAWQSPAVQEYYTGLKLPGWMLFFQFFRAVIWGFIALLIMKTMAAKTWQIGLATALLFSVLMSATLLLPGNPIMPDAVRIAHFIEIMLSNFLFGWLVVGIIDHGSARHA